MLAHQSGAKVLTFVKAPEGTTADGRLNPVSVRTQLNLIHFPCMITIIIDCREAFYIFKLLRSVYFCLVVIVFFFGVHDSNFYFNVHGHRHLALEQCVREEPRMTSHSGRCGHLIPSYPQSLQRCRVLLTAYQWQPCKMLLTGI
jgi:hypothetical protein